jgi:glycosyltransferase involved in cell wall biosynthesis
VLGKTWGWRSTISALRALRKLRPDRVLLEYTPFLFGAVSPAPIVIAWACRTLRIPCVLIAHEIFYDGASAAVSSRSKGRYFALRDRFVLRGAARIAVPNVERRDRVRARLPALTNRIDIVPIAANVEPDAGYSHAESQHGVFRIAAFGVVMPRRRYEIAIRALALVRNTIDARLTIIGRIFDAEYMQRCAALAEDLGIGGSLKFTDSLEPSQVSAHLARTDAAVHTTAEGSTRSSGSLLALLAHGIAVVATRTPFDDICFEDVVLHADADPAALADVLLFLAMDPSRATQIGRRALNKYRQYFDWRALAESLAS